MHRQHGLLRPLHAGELSDGTLRYLLWIAALLASLLAFDRLFQADAEDGSLDLLHLGDTPLELAVLVKCAAHWMATGLPLIIAAPFLGLMLQQERMALLDLAVHFDVFFGEVEKGHDFGGGKLLDSQKVRGAEDRARARRGH